MNRHVFISYVRDDQALVDSICRDLTQSGVQVWLDRNSIRPGSFWKDAIQEAIQSGDFFVACFSEAYLQRDKSYMNEEITLAIEELRQYPTTRSWFIPILLTDCLPPNHRIGAGTTLRDLQSVPLFKDWDGGIKAIVSVINPVPTKIQTLLAALNSDNVAIRIEATKSLATVRHKDVVLSLIRCCRDSNFKVRVAAAEALSVHNEDNATKVLASMLTDTHYAVRLAAAKGVGRTSPRNAVNELCYALNDKTAEVRIWAAKALCQVNDNATIPFWIKAIDDNRIYREAEVAFRLLGASAVPALIEAMQKKSWRGRLIIVWILGAIRSPAAVQAVRMALADKNWLVREAASKALKMQTENQPLTQDKSKKMSES